MSYTKRRGRVAASQDGRVVLRLLRSLAGDKRRRGGGVATARLDDWDGREWMSSLHNGWIEVQIEFYKYFLFQEVQINFNLESKIVSSRLLIQHKYILRKKLQS